MTDEEITRRIAEIEGWKYKLDDVGQPFWGPYDSDDVYMNPFDWSVLGPLAVKHHIWISEEENGIWVASCPPHAIVGPEDFQKSESLPHAILLAIIEANK